MAAARCTTPRLWDTSRSERRLLYEPFRSYVSSSKPLPFCVLPSYLICYNLWCEHVHYFGSPWMRFLR
jgi:hypothetical protein